MERQKEVMTLREASEYLGPRYRQGAGILSSGGDDFFGIYRVMGIPLAHLRGAGIFRTGLPGVSLTLDPRLLSGNPVGLRGHCRPRQSGTAFRSNWALSLCQ